MVTPDYRSVDQIASGVDSILKKLGVSTETVSGILADSDWAFFIKLYAMIEASLNHLLIVRLADNRIEDVIVKMDVSEKLAFVKSLSLLPDQTRIFIKTLSEIRNRIAHGLGGLNFDFSTYVSKMEKHQRKSLLDGMRSLLPTMKVDEELRRNPRNTLFMCVCIVLFEIESNLPKREPDPSSPHDAHAESNPKE